MWNCHYESINSYTLTAVYIVTLILVRSKVYIKACVLLFKLRTRQLQLLNWGYYGLICSFESLNPFLESFEPFKISVTPRHPSLGKGSYTWSVKGRSGSGMRSFLGKTLFSVWTRLFHFSILNKIPLLVRKRFLWSRRRTRRLLREEIL